MFPNQLSSPAGLPPNILIATHVEAMIEHNKLLSALFLQIIVATQLMEEWACKRHVWLYCAERNE